MIVATWSPIMPRDTSLSDSRCTFYKLGKNWVPRLKNSGNYFVRLLWGAFYEKGGRLGGPTRTKVSRLWFGTVMYAALVMWNDWFRNQKRLIPSDSGTKIDWFLLIPGTKMSWFGRHIAQLFCAERSFLLVSFVGCILGPTKGSGSGAKSSPGQIFILKTAILNVETAFQSYCDSGNNFSKLFCYWKPEVESEGFIHSATALLYRHILLCVYIYI